MEGGSCQRLSFFRGLGRTFPTPRDSSHVAVIAKRGALWDVGVFLPHVTRCSRLSLKARTGFIRVQSSSGESGDTPYGFSSDGEAECYTTNVNIVEWDSALRSWESKAVHCHRATSGFRWFMRSCQPVSALESCGPRSYEVTRLHKDVSFCRPIAVCWVLLPSQ